MNKSNETTTTATTTTPKLTDISPNFRRMDVNGFSYWVSYEALIAFRAPGEPPVVHENIWTRTTGKHLNLVDRDHKARVTAREFEQLLKAAHAEF